MQHNSERMREELGTLNRHTENLESVVGERAERIGGDLDQLTQDLHIQLERRKEHLKKMGNDVVQIGESLHNLVADFGEHRKTTNETQSKIQSSLYVLDQTIKKDHSASRTLQTTAEVVPPGNRYGMAAVPTAVAAQVPQMPGRAGAMQLEPVAARPMMQVVVPATSQPMVSAAPQPRPVYR